jgi:predicted DCC family thiol-disulfide oxidoreductase YuxK
MQGLDLVRGGPIVVFDGSCGLCNGWVDFVLRHDVRGVFRFTPLQSPTGASLLDTYGLPATDTSSIVLVTEQGALRQSTAVLHILRRLGGIWSLGYAAIVIPTGIRDAVYDFVAAHRYQWFGTQDVCRMPTPAERKRFV